MLGFVGVIVSEAEALSHALQPSQSLQSPVAAVGATAPAKSDGKVKPPALVTAGGVAAPGVVLGAGYEDGIVYDEAPDDCAAGLVPN